MSDSHDHRGRGLEATGVAGISATVSHNRIGRTAAAVHNGVQNRRLADIQAQKTAARRTTASPTPHPTWAKAGADQGVSGGAARRAALGARTQQLRHLQSREDNVRRAIRGSGVLRARAASTALRGGLAVGPAALYLGARRRAEPIAKYTTRDVNAGATGAAVGLGGYQAAGWYGGHALEAKAKAKTDADPALRRRLDEHRAASGITGKTPTGDKKWLGFFRKYPKELPGAGTKRVLSYTHAGKTGVAANVAVAAGAGAAAVAARRHHDNKVATVSKSDPFEVSKRDSEDARMQSRVIRGGPYTKRNRRQLAHHAGVGGAIGGSAGVAAGAHLGAHIHGSVLRDSVRGLDYAPEVSRGKSALLIGGAIGAAGAGYGALTGAAVAGEQRKRQRMKAQIRHEQTKVAKSEPLGIAGAAYRAPGRFAEFKRAYSGTRKGERIVDRASVTPKTRPIKDQWGYTRGHEAIGDHGGDARQHLRAATSRARENSNHRSAFGVGTHAGRAAATASRHPEYAVSVPAAGVGVGVIHHEVSGKNKKKKEASVAKSAFGVEISKDDGPSAKRGAKRGAVVGGALGVVDTAAAHGSAHATIRAMEGRGPSVGEHLRALPKTAPGRILPAAALGAGVGALAGHQAKKRRDKRDAEVAKYDRGTITYHHEQASLHSRKKASGGRQAAGGAAAAGVGVAAHMNHKRIGEEVGNRLERIPGSAEHLRTTRNASEAARKGGAGLAVAGGALAAVGATRWVHHGRKQNQAAAHAQRARAERNASIVGKSAFGVEDVRLEKSILTSGLEALKGAKNGLNGAVGAERTAAGAAGKYATAATKGKIMPVARTLTATKARTGMVAGGAGLGTGLALSNKRNS